MFSTILVPVDGSPLAERAVPYAARLARAASGRLVLARVVMRHDVPSVAPTLSEAAARVEAELTELAEKARADGTRVETRVFQDHEEAAPAILEGAREEQAGLIAMSTHGRGGFGRWIYGSVADTVLRHAEMPVLLVPATCERAWDGGAKRSIVVPLDGSRLAEEALGPAESLAQALGASLHLLQIAQLPNYSYGYVAAYPVYIQFDAEAEMDQALSYLERIATGLRSRGLTVEVHATVGLAPSLIAQAAREEGAMAIAMTSHGRGGLARLVLGSVATQILQMSAVPVLLSVSHPAATLKEPAE